VISNAPILTKREEWARGWPLPVIAMLGITGPAAFAYTNGIFMEVMTEEFGWNKTEFSSAMLLQMLIGLIVAPLAARVLDRVGSRRVLLAGIIPFALGLSILGLANGALWQWWLLSVVFAIATAGVISAAWVGGVVQNFNSARGMAIAMCLAGIGVATVGWPLIAAELVKSIGWRLTFPAMAFGWLILLLPLVYFFYKPDVQQRPLGVQVLPLIGPSVRTRTFWIVLCAGGLFSSVQFGLIVHLFPTVRLQGLSMALAASMVSITGVFSILGRLCTGALLDWIPTKPLAIFAFLLPLPVMALLGIANGSTGLLMLASALLGFAAGSETDVVAYLCSRRFDRRIFGRIYTLFQMTFAVTSSLGPLLASRLVDVSGSYASYYGAAGAMIGIATMLILFLPASDQIVTDDSAE
jgi:MFS family permease